MKAAPSARRWAALAAWFREPTRYELRVVAALILLAVAGMGWFQYTQIDRFSQASMRGRDNLIWDFYKLELQLANVQLALNGAVAEPDQPALLAEVSREYEIFVSQVHLLQTLNSGRVMRDHAIYVTAMAESLAYIEQVDVHLASHPGKLTPLVAQSLLRQSQALRAPLHRLVLDAYLVENQRVNAQLEAIRRFTLYYGVMATFLILLTLWVGWLVVGNLSLAQRRQAEQSEQWRKQKEMAEAATQAKARFLSAASHDLRQPAHALGLFVSQLAPLAVDPRARRLLAGANAAVLDMQNMLDGLFDLSRLEAPSTEVRLKAFPLEPLFEQLRNGFGRDAAAKGLRLRVRGTPVWVRSDPVLLRRILLNLVSNAIRYSERGSVLVACRSTREPDCVRIEVRDSGIGIAPEDHAKIFQEFHQVDNPQRDRSNGLGVGLSIVERCSRLLDRPVRLQSAPGCGSCFSLTLVRVPGQSNEVANEAFDPGLQHNELAGLNILVMDDDALGREALGGLLTSWGSHVVAVGSAQAALAHCQQAGWPDLIISDFRMVDGQNGVQAISRLREMAGRNMAACVVSGDTDAQVAQQVQAAGLVLLGKPVRPAKLRGLLRHLARGQAA